MNQTVPDAWQSRTPVERDILATLAAEGALNGNELAAALGKNANNLIKRLRALETAGLIDRTPSDAGKGAPVHNALTDDGRDLVERGVVDVADRVRLARGDA